MLCSALHSIVIPLPPKDVHRTAYGATAAPASAALEGSCGGGGMPSKYFTVIPLILGLQLHKYTRQTTVVVYGSTTLQAKIWKHFPEKSLVVDSIGDGLELL